MTGWALECVHGAIPVRLSRAQRRTIALHLRPGPVLELRAPRGCPERVLRDFLDSRRHWVERHVPELPAPMPTPEFVDGERHWFLGEARSLRLNRGRRYRCRLRGGEIRLAAPQPQRPDLVAGALEQWYRQQAEAVFGGRLDAWRDHLAGWRLPRPTLRLRRMRRRWGSCSDRGVITLNTRLVKRSPALIDHVIVHELCHLLEFNHSPRFYALMDAALPDWRQRSRALDAGLYRL